MRWIKAQDGTLYNLNWVVQIEIDKEQSLEKSEFHIIAVTTNGAACERELLGEYDSEVQADTALDDLIIKMENVVK